MADCNADFVNLNAMKKVLTVILILAAAAALGFFLFNRFFPGIEIPFLSGENSPIKGIVCSYPVRVSGQSMEPLLKANSLVVFNKCISKTKNDLATGTVIVFSQDGPMRIMVVREKLEGESGIYYKAYPAARPQDFADVFPDDIVATYTP